jgi:hypothetical protein
MVEIQSPISALHRGPSIVSRSALLQSNTAALYKCAKVNIFRDHNLEKMGGHHQALLLAGF